MVRSSDEEQFELLRRPGSFDSLDELDPLHDELRNKYPARSSIRRLLSPRRALRTPLKAARSCCGSRRTLLRLILGFVIVLLTFTALFRPSYTHLPPHYKALQERALASQEPGRANPNNEKIFICVSLYDKGGKLAVGEWGEKLLDVIDLLGPNNTFLSIYENGSGALGAKALQEFEARVPCEKEIVYDEDVDKLSFPKITLPDGSERVKRLTYLSDIRNRALRPLDKVTDVKYNKILFLNDVFYHPIEAVHLLLSTNQQGDGRTDYVGACAMDFHDDPIKFYDAFASRDFGGYSMGVPFYPFFSSAGGAESRSDILAQKDAVRVKSCWSGMAAFQAEHFQAKEELPESLLDPGSHNIDPMNPQPIKGPVRFRSEPEPFFDACECCLLMADALKLSRGTTNITDDTGIYMNPYIRVAYGPEVLSWLHFVRRFERTYVWIQWFVNTIAFMPTWNPHREVKEGDAFKEEAWIPPTNGTESHWEIQDRIGRNGMYCGVREMQVLKLTEDRAKDRNWEKVQVPSGRQFF